METALVNMSKTELIKFIDEQNSRLKEQKTELQKQDSELQQQKYLIAQLRRMLFGSKRERFEKVDSAQGVIPFEEYATQEQKQDQTSIKEIITYEREKPKRHQGRNKLPENLPVIEHIIEPEEDTSNMIKIGEERTEILEYTPGEFLKLIIVRPKYAVKEENQSLELADGNKNVVIAELPSRPIPKCLAGNSLLSAIAINKYIDHLPLYRQRQIFKRSDIEIAASTIDSWIAYLGKLFKPLYDRLVQEVRSQTYLQADETTTKVLDETKKGKTHLGYYWAYHAPLHAAVVFDYQKGRGIDAPRAFLEHYNGYLQTDGYQVYKHYYANDRVIHLACWAHVRRKFEHALDNNKEIAEHVLLEIQKLYSIERKTKELSADQRKEFRLNEALPITNALGKYLGHKRSLVLPTSETGKAITYATNLWSSLQSYLYDGNLQIDNNLIENKIRPIALGRKNYLFAGSHNGAERSAMFYSFFSCCKLNSINPQKWMVYVLANIADYPANKIHELLPNIIDPEKLENYRDFWERKM
ncbi:MAG: IS66 family transposase [Bacteroidales bacterium]|jgi:transposase|nr:IS66 family transposase [Bacteroidales bacterium]